MENFLNFMNLKNEGGISANSRIIFIKEAESFQIWKESEVIFPRLTVLGNEEKNFLKFQSSYEKM